MLHSGRGTAGEARQRELHRPAAPDEGAGAATRRRLALMARRMRRGRGGGPEEPQLQVLLRLQISRPRLHNVLTTFKLSLAGGWPRAAPLAPGLC
jgi:hypothetical protein